MPKLVSFTLQTALLSDAISLEIRRQDGAWVVVLTATVRDETGAVRQTAAYTKALTAAQRTTIENFVSTQLLPALNAQEGL